MTLPPQWWHAALLPFFLLTAACAEGPTAPSGGSEAAPQLARDGTVGSGSTITVLEPFALQQARLYADEGIVRHCIVNPFEDLDGDDWVRLDPAGAFQQHFVNEHDAFVLVREAPASAPGQFVPVGVGRAVWKAIVWKEVTGPGTAVLSSIASRVQGVVAPLDFSVPGPYGDVRDVIVADNQNIVETPLGPGDPAVDAIDRALAAAQDAGTLRGIDCEWNQGWKPFVVNEVRWIGPWPRALSRLF